MQNQDSKNSASPLLDGLRVEAARIEEDTEHSAKRHFNSCELWSKLHYGLGIPATIAAAAASAAVVKDAPLAAQLLALTAALLTALMTFLKPNDKALQHKNMGNQYLALRNDSRMFRELELRKPIDEGKKGEKLDRLAQRRNDLNSTAPSTSRWAFERTRKGIAEGETRYQVDQRD